MLSPFHFTSIGPQNLTPGQLNFGQNATLNWQNRVSEYFCCFIMYQMCVNAFYDVFLVHL